MMVKFTPRTFSALRGDESTSESEAKKHGSQVSKSAEFFAQSQDALFRSNLSGSPFLRIFISTRRVLCCTETSYWATDSAENDRIGAFCCSKCFIGKRVVVRVY
jgi:hypothetical protein